VANYPVELESVVMKALAKNKAERFQTAREFSRALQGVLMRRGAFVGPEEIANFVRQLFDDRIERREAHLAWAAEVTSTINIDQLRAGQIALPGPTDDPLKGKGEARRTGGPSTSQTAMPALRVPPTGAAPQQQMSASSLMDDDEDVPTTVASREHLEAVRAPQMTVPDRAPPRPAAGSPAATGSGQHAAVNPAAHGYAPQAAYPHEGLGSTIAMPSMSGLIPHDPNAHRGPYAQQPQPQSQHPQAYPGYAQQPANYGSAYAHARRNSPVPSSYGYGAPGMHPSSPPGTPSAPPGMPSVPPHGSPVAPGIHSSAPPGFPSAPPPHAHASSPPMPQSKIETNASLPRSDAAAVWLAEQEAAAKRPKKGGAGAIIAICLVVVALGGAVVFYFLKRRTPVAPPSPAPAASSLAPGSSAAPPTDAPSASPTTSATDSPAGSGAAAPAAPDPASSSADGKEEPGFLTIVCNPFCDDVSDSGRSLGASPIVKVPAKPGQHRITLKRAGIQQKNISVIIVSGQVTSQRVSMK
jgi:serine/threonine-protein kinase